MYIYIYLWIYYNDVFIFEWHCRKKTETRYEYDIMKIVTLTRVKEC